MNASLIHGQERLHDSLFELYIDGGLELFHDGTRGLKRELIIDLETSALTPEKEVSTSAGVHPGKGDHQ
jgi:hypothetical protein